MSGNDIADTLHRVSYGLEPESDVPDLNKEWTQSDFLQLRESDFLRFPALSDMVTLYRFLGNIRQKVQFGISDLADASNILFRMKEKYSRLPSDPRSYFLFYQALTGLHDFPLALSILDELIALMPIPSSFIARKRQIVVDYLAQLQQGSDEAISKQNDLPNTAFRLRYLPNLPHFPPSSTQLRHQELIPFLRGLSKPDFQALEKLQRYTAIETNRIEGQLLQLGRDDTYTKIILRHGITADVIAHTGIPDPHYITLVLSDTVAASDTCMEIVRQHSSITTELLIAIHAQLLQHSRIGLALDPKNNQALAAILTGRFKLMPNSPVVRSTSPGAPPLLHQYCPPSLVEDHMSDFMAKAEVYLKDKALDPYLLAAWLHYAFVAIHPFQDGNGRMARLLASIALCGHRLFPLLITMRDKRRYQDVLLSANGGDLLPLSRFIVDMQVQSSLVVLSKPDSFRALDSDSLTRISNIATGLTTSFASYDIQTEVGLFDGTNTMNQETSWVVRKDASTSIRLLHRSNVIGQVLITTVDPFSLGIVIIDLRDAYGSSLELGVIRKWNGGAFDGEALSGFVTLVMSHVENGDLLR